MLKEIELVDYIHSLLDLKKKRVNRLLPPAIWVFFW